MWTNLNIYNDLDLYTKTILEKVHLNKLNTDMETCH